MKRIVWVDDDPLLSRPFKQELEIFGFALIYLESCAQYLDFIDNGGLADLFILDLVMKPEGRITNLTSNYGLETGVPLAFETQRIYPQTPILVFTNTANLNAREEAKKKLSVLGNVTLVPKSRMTQAMDFAKLVTSLLDVGETGVSGVNYFFRWRQLEFSIIFDLFVVVPVGMWVTAPAVIHISTGLAPSCVGSLTAHSAGNACPACASWPPPLDSSAH